MNMLSMRNMRRVAQTVLVVIAFGSAVRVHAQNRKTELMSGEKLSGPRTFCIAISQSETPSYEPTIYLSVGFAENTDGYFEVDDNRIHSWVNEGGPQNH